MTKPFDTFDHFEKKHTCGEATFDNGIVLYTCKHCGAEKTMNLPSLSYVGAPLFVDEARATLKDHLSLCEVYNNKDRPARRMIITNEGIKAVESCVNDILKRDFDCSLLRRLIEEGERVGKSPWCCDLFHESRAHEILNQRYFPKHFPQELMEETVARREKETKE